MGPDPAAESAPERPALAGVPASHRQKALQIALPVLVAVVVGLFVGVVSIKDGWHNEFDLKVYRGAVQWWLEGKPLYAFHRHATPYGLTYPPFAAVAMLPWAAVSELTAMVVNEVLSAV